MPCTLDCLLTYGCGQPIEPLEGAVYAPYMRMDFDGGRILTVGNASAPPDNHATISSLTYGLSVGTTGLGCDIEIIDQGGVMYRRIIAALNKTISLAESEAFNTTIDFGWIVTSCDGETRLESAFNQTGKKIHAIMTEVEQTYEGGIVKLKVKLRGPQARIPEVRHDGTEGDEDDKITLKQALRRLFEEHQPTFSEVEFRNAAGAGEFDFSNSDGGPEGPRGAWPMGQQNPLATARTWLNSVTTADNRGILIIYDPDSVSLVFQEDPRNGGCCDGSLGTYVVNGGNCSPVLGFNPTINWPKGFIPGGGAATGGSASGDNEEYIEPLNNIERAGTQTGPTVQQHEWMWRNPDELASGAQRGFAAQMDANGFYDGAAKGGMEAELKIHGNPSYIDPVKLVGRTLSLIVINPFHVADRDGDCTWITTSNCNATLSNKKWMVRGVSHQINGGSYVTTFNLMLPIPNRDIDATDALGGNGCGSEVFENSIEGDANDG